MKYQRNSCNAPNFPGLTTPLVNNAIIVIKINILKFWTIVESNGLNILFKLIFNIDDKIQQKVSGYIFRILEKRLSMSREVINHN